jgi:hypothetical protein
VRLQPQPGTVTIITTTIITAVDGVPGMGARRVGPSKAAFVSRIIMVRGTGTDTATGTGTVNLEVASNKSAFILWLVLLGDI